MYFQLSGCIIFRIKKFQTGINTMPLKEMPGFIVSHKHTRNAVLCSLLMGIFLILQLFLMRRTALTVVFDVVIPFSAAVTFACYAITMAYDRPFILICPPMVYFISLLINQLFSVEVGVGETYPIFTLIEIIPVLFYCFSAASLKLKSLTDIILKVGCGLILATISVLLILALFFRITLYSQVSQTFALASGMLAILFFYIGMIEQLKIAGSEKRPHQPFRLFKAPKNEE